MLQEASFPLIKLQEAFTLAVEMFERAIRRVVEYSCQILFTSNKKLFLLLNRLMSHVEIPFTENTEGIQCTILINFMWQNQFNQFLPCQLRRHLAGKPLVSVSLS